MKRFIYLGSIILVLVGIVMAGYYYKKFKDSAPAITPEQTAGTGTLPGSGEPQTIQLPTSTVSSTIATSSEFGLFVKDPLVDYSVSADASVTYLQTDGQVVRAKGSDREILSSSKIQNIVRSAFSPDGKYLYVLFGNAISPRASIFDVNAKSWEPIDGVVFAAAWPAQGDRLLLLRKDAVGNHLSIRTLEDPKKKFVELGGFSFQDSLLYWVSSSTIIFSDKAAAGIEGSVWKYAAAKKTLTPILDSIPSLTAIWSTNGNYGFTLQNDPSHGHYSSSLIDQNGVVFANFSFVTIPEKCVFFTPTLPSSTDVSSTPSISPEEAISLVCAIPQKNAEFSLRTLPDDYQRRSLYSIDSFYSISIPSSQVARVLPAAKGDFDATHLMVANGRLFFINRYDNRLYGGTL